MHMYIITLINENILHVLCRDISFLYDATVPEKTAVDSVGKTLSMLSSDKSKASPPDRQLGLVEKNRGELDQGNMVRNM